MAWFKRTEKGIQTATEDKKDVPKGLWYKSPTGKIIDQDELAKNLWVSPDDDFHVRIGSKEYFEILFDNNEFKELDAKMTSKDPLHFVLERPIWQKNETNARLLKLLSNQYFLFEWRQRKNYLYHTLPLHFSYLILLLSKSSLYDDQKIE